MGLISLCLTDRWIVSPRLLSRYHSQSHMVAVSIIVLHEIQTNLSGIPLQNLVSVCKFNIGKLSAPGISNKLMEKSFIMLWPRLKALSSGHDGKCFIFLYVSFKLRFGLV